MDNKTASQLLSLNHKFYQTFAQDFSETRQRLQPGVLKVLEEVPRGVSILDLGCGNGELARVLAERDFPCSYTGVDFSSNLMAEAREDLPPNFQGEFYPLDLTLPDWEDRLPDRKFDLIFAFAVYHHLPGRRLRRQVSENVHRRLRQEGTFYLSNWQFLKSERLARRIQPWSAAGIEPDRVEEDDYLLDWRRGGLGLRYVHYFTAQELEALAAETGFQVESTFFSDGKSDNLSIYQAWKPVSGPR